MGSYYQLSLNTVQGHACPPHGATGKEGNGKWGGSGNRNTNGKLKITTHLHIRWMDGLGCGLGLEQRGQTFHHEAAETTSVAKCQIFLEINLHGPY